MANIIEIIIKAKDEASAALKRLNQSMKDIGAGMTSIGSTMSMAVTAPIVAGLGLAVKNASDLAETANKVNVIFGDMAGSINEFASSAATSFGMSKQAALDAASTFGVFGNSAGLAGGDLTDFSKSLTGLASDLASFYNTSPEDAIVALGAALRGESEPIRRYGVLLDDATLRQKALEMGIVSTTKDALTPQQRVLAAYAVIMQQTTAAQGDFARTSDGLANSSRILKAQLTDVAGQLGTQLLPIALQIATALRDLLSGFTNMSPALQNTILIVAGVAAAIGPLLVILGSLLGAITAITTFLAGPAAAAIGAAIAAAAPILAIIAAIIAAIVLLKLAWDSNFLGIRDITASVVAAVVGFWQGTLLPALQAVWNWLSTVLFPFFQAFGNFLSSVFGLVVTALAGLWQNVLLPALQAVGNFIKANITPIFQALGTFLGTVFGPVITRIAGFIGTLRGAFEGVSNAIRGVTQWLQTMADKISNMKLPDWLTPGSPTPFEMGLRGIGSALEEINGAALPQFQAGLQMQPPGGALGYAAGGTQKNTSNYYNLTIHEAGQRGNVVSDFSLLRSLAGA